jgi:hypothetical protein
MIKRKIFLFITFLVFSFGFLTYLFFSENKIFAAVESMDVIKIDSSTPNVPNVTTQVYGFSIANIGDLDGDNVDDILVGAPVDDTGGTNYGAAYIHFMNIDGSVDSTIKIDSNTVNGPTLGFDNFRYGWSVAGIGDLNDDGVRDIAVGALSYFNNSSIYTGRVFIHFMNTDGSIDSTVLIDRSTVNGPNTTRNVDGNDFYGSAIDGLGDLNGDGVEDLIVGASFDSAGGSARGAAFIHFMNTDGSIDSTVKINGSTLNGPVLSNTDNYGSSVANIGDLNGDGVSDIAVGADGIADSILSYFYIHFMNTDGSIDSSVKIDKNTANGATGLGTFFNYATSLEGLGDMNGDGIPDIAVGAVMRNSSIKGGVFVHYMDSDGTIKATDVIDDTTQDGLSLGPTDMYGTGVALLEDYSGDGVVDIAVGTRVDAFYIHFIDIFAEMSRTPSVVVSESGTDGVVTVGIDFLAPGEDVEVVLTHNDQITLDKTTLTFTPLNWETPQTVTVSAVDDLVNEGTHLSTINYTVSSLDNNFNGISLPQTSVIITDNDAPPGVNVVVSNDYGENYDVTEDFVENYLAITLTYENTEDVTITLTPDSQLDIELSGPGVPYDVVIPAGNWNTGVTIAVWANDDMDIEGNHMGNISYTLSSLDPNYDGLVVADTELRIRDNDVGMVVTESSGDTSVVEGGDTDTLNVSLGAAPTEDVLVNVSSLVGELSFSSDVLTFTALNWFEDQTITITAVNDSEIEGNHTDTINFSVSSIDLNYNEYLLDSVGVDIEDNDSLAPDPEPEESRGSSGSILPHIRFKNNIKETDTRFVDIEAWVPGTITYFEISNTPDFKVKETYQREYLQKDLYWDLCKGLDICSYGEKFVYARFYSDFLVPAEDTISIDYKGSCPYFKDYIRMGHKNNKDEVIKVQEFLNRQIGSSLVLDGIVGNKTDRAIRNFQDMYPVQILHPWNGLKTSTGWWYITTKSFANVLMGCK